MATFCALAMLANKSYTPPIPGESSVADNFIPPATILLVSLRVELAVEKFKGFCCCAERVALCPCTSCDSFRGNLPCHHLCAPSPWLLALLPMQNIGAWSFVTEAAEANAALAQTNDWLQGRSNPLSSHTYPRPRLRF